MNQPSIGNPPPKQQESMGGQIASANVDGSPLGIDLAGDGVLGPRTLAALRGIAGH